MGYEHSNGKNQKTYNRRSFLKTTGITAAGVISGISAVSGSAPVSKDKRPNIIYIYTDQQSASMMSCAGNQWLKTPAMDYIAKNGIRFTRAYTTNPVCSPARVSLMTGRFAGEFNDSKGNQVRENSGSMRIPSISDDVKNTTIAAYMKKAGYELIFGGKEHLPKMLTPTALGFRDITNNERQILADKAAQEIKTNHNNPYFMIVSLINPHDICYMALRDYHYPHGTGKGRRQNVKPFHFPKTEITALDNALRMPEGVTEDEFFKKHCPPLPLNYEPQKDEPKAIASLLDRREFRRFVRENYTDRQWRMHRWAYCGLTELVDRRVQTILDALKQSGQEENTLIIFSSDHGDHDAAHRMEHKTAFYEESVKIPFTAMWKGKIPAGRVDDKHLVSNGLDLLPTVCDYAGIKAVADPRGKSLRPLFEGKQVSWRNTLGIESEIGRMVVSADNLKYIRYDAEGIEERLHDLNADPWEKTHFTDDPKYAVRLKELRKEFKTKWFPNAV